MVSFFNCIQEAKLLGIFELSSEPLVTKVRSRFDLNCFDVSGIPKASVYAHFQVKEGL